MSRGNKKHIEKIISKIGVEKAPTDFTKKVMQDIFVSSNEEVLKDEKLTSLLREIPVEMPSNVFVSNIMKEVETTRIVEFKPLISKKGWLIISSLFVGILIFMTFNDSPVESPSIFDKISPYLEETKNMFSNPLKDSKFFTGTNLSPILAISLLCLSTMLFFDSVLKKRLFT